MDPSKSVVDRIDRGTSRDTVVGEPDQPTMYVHIDKLTCSNSLQGCSSCSMALARTIKKGLDTCVILSSAGPGVGVPFIRIECPIGIQLAR